VSGGRFLKDIIVSYHSWYLLVATKKGIERLMLEPEVRRRLTSSLKQQIIRVPLSLRLTKSGEGMTGKGEKGAGPNKLGGRKQPSWVAKKQYRSRGDCMIKGRKREGKKKSRINFRKKSMRESCCHEGKLQHADKNPIRQGNHGRPEFRDLDRVKNAITLQLECAVKGGVKEAGQGGACL